MERLEHTTFFRSREREERALAEQASDPSSRYAHHQMAALYRAKASEADGEHSRMTIPII